MENTNESMMKKGLWAGFVSFIREQGVAGFAIGFIIGGGVSKVVTALVTDIINPLVGLMFGGSEGLKSAAVKVGEQQFMWGDFVSAVIDFLIIALVVYVIFKSLRLEKLDKKV